MAGALIKVWQMVQNLKKVYGKRYIIGRQTPCIGRQTLHNRDGKRPGFWCAFTKSAFIENQKKEREISWSSPLR